jgi:CRISPR-associated protein Cas2
MDCYLLAYDICNPQRLRKAAQTWEDCGFRRQYSVFLCRLSTADLVRLKSRLYEIINLEEDQVLFIPLCHRCADGIEALGGPVEKHDARDLVIEK